MAALFIRNQIMKDTLSDTNKIEEETYLHSKPDDFIPDALKTDADD